ncbi:MAG: hypothetical protein AB1403_19375 [Candidatus Riflebacteria bacterium]
MEKIADTSVLRSRPSEPVQPNREAKSYAKMAPEEKREQAIEQKARPAPKTLGSRIDVYA